MDDGEDLKKLSWKSFRGFILLALLAYWFIFGFLERDYEFIAWYLTISCLCWVLFRGIHFSWFI